MHNELLIIAVIGHPILLDDVLESHNVCDRFVAETRLDLVSCHLGSLVHYQRSTIALYPELISGLLNLDSEFLVADKIHCGLVV